MDETIRIRPADGLRQDFARWAVAQQPKVRTCSTHEFAVPAGLYTHMPDELLVGALVDGHLYVPVEEAHASGTPEPEPGPAEAERVAEPGELLPDADPSGYPEDAQPLDPAETVGEPERVRCGDCPKDFANARALKAHRRQVHPEA